MVDVTIDDLTDAAPAEGADRVEIMRAGLSFRLDVADIAQYANGLLTAGAPTGFDTFAEVAASLALKANIASPTFTGTPAGPTAAPGTNTTQLATTAFVAAAVSGSGGGTVTSVSGTGTVSGLTLTGTVTTSGSLTLGGTLSVSASNFASQTANTVLAAPNGSSGTPTFRTLAVADLPALNGLSGLQITGTTSPPSGSGLEFQGGASGIIQAYNRGGSSYINMTVDGLSIAQRVSGTTRVLTNSAAMALTGIPINEAVEVAIASASTTDLATAAANSVQITGTATITALGTVSSGVRRSVRFAAALTLTHNGTSLILPTAANITTAAGDTAEFMSLGSGNWVCLRYNRASGAALVGGGGTAADIQIFTANGTWTKPAGSPVRVEVHVFGGGGGGGGGGKAASGTAVSGGGGGGGGAHAVAYFAPGDLSATESVTVGAGGTSGAGATVNNTLAGLGGAGGTSNFASKVYAYGGGRGYGGDDAANAGGGGGATLYGAGGDGTTSGGAAGTGAGAGAGSASANGAAGSTGGGGGAGASAAGTSAQGGGQGGVYGGAGGGAGGGVTTAPVAGGGGQGRPGPGTDAATALSGGTTGGGAGPTHSPTTTTQLRAGGGGAGGGASTTTDGGAGGAGQAPGGGGGGGGASISNNGGAGGVGGLGRVVVITTY